MKPQWIFPTPNEPLPKNLVKAGENAIVGRVHIEGELLPATVDAEKSCAFACKEGREYVKNKYQLLIDKGYSWQPCEWGYFPPLAVDFNSRKKKGKQMFIGCANYGNCVQVGSVDPHLGLIYFAHNGQEITLRSYKILILDNTANWISCRSFYTPSDAVVVGNLQERYSESIIYVGRALYEGQWLLANVYPNLSSAYVWHQRAKVYVRDYQLLCGNGYRWHKPYDKSIPSNALTMGTTASGEPLYIRRDEDMGGFSSATPSDYEILVHEF